MPADHDGECECRCAERVWRSAQYDPPPNNVIVEARWANGFGRARLRSGVWMNMIGTYPIREFVTHWRPIRAN